MDKPVPTCLGSLLLAAITSLTVVTGGCAAPGMPPPDRTSGHGGSEYLACARFFHSLHAAVDQTGVTDAQTAPVPGYPYLHANRFLASLRHRGMTRPMLEAWVDRLQALGEKAWATELTNLPPGRRERLSRVAPGGQPLDKAVHQCGQSMRRVDLARPRDLNTLRRRVSIPGDYRAARRVLGLYPLTAVFFSFGVTQLHQQTMSTFSQPLADLPVKGSLTRYIPPSGPSLSSDEVADLLSRSATNALHIPEPDARRQARLFATFAPVWEVDVANPDDRIGAPVWRGRTVPDVDTQRPVVYHLLSHVWWDHRPLLQLNYVIWFPSRPATGPVDLYAGHLDGIILRVTLGAHGHPLVYDSIHDCGCYHKFFPTRRVRPRPPGESIRGEPVLLPQQAPELGPGERLVVRIAHRTHYVERLYAAAGDTGGNVYRLAAYDNLRTLATPDGGHRSLFDRRGFVPGTERAERWLLWPMGVPEPGAMRQWGHHAVAFVGERYFDDPHLLEKVFVPVSLYKVLNDP